VYGVKSHCNISEANITCFYRGFPRTGPKANKVVKGFQTGDMLKAVITKGTKIGTYVGRVALRSSGSFNIKTNTVVV